MTTIVTRSGKGTALTHTEVDANFTNLNTNKAEVSTVLLASEKGAASGVCPLDSTSKVSSTYLPSYVDDVLEYANYAALPATGETGKIYVALDTNKTYRWSGSAYIYITSGAVDSVAGKTGVVTLDKTDVGLSNVSNTAQVTSVTGTSPIISSGGVTPSISISAATTTYAGSMSAADKAKIDAVTGTNTGDETASTIKTKLGITTLSGSNTGDQTITLTGGVTGSGTGSFAATVVTNANLTGAITSSGNATSLGSFTSLQLATALTDETGSGAAVFATSPTLVTPALGTPSALVGTNITGTASGLTAGNVTTNANLTGAITSVGNATSLGSFTSANLAAALTNETGSGSAVFSDNATLLNPTYTGTLTGSTGILNIGSGQLYKDASGNVGIGTGSPSYKLHVRGSATGALTALQIDNSSSAGIGNQTYLNIFTFDSSQYRGGKIYSSIDGAAWTDARLTLQSQLNGGAYDDTLTLRGGNVGIGTSTPSSLLSIQKYNPAGLGPELILNNSGNSVSDSMAVTFASGAIGSGARGQIKVTVDNNPYYGIMTFSRGSSNATLVESMRIDPSGNLLVGTTSAVANARSTIAVPQGGANEAPLGLAHGPYSHRIGPNSNGSFVVYRASDNVGQYQTYGATSWTSTSDERLKTDLIPIENGLEKVISLRSVTGRFKTDEVGTSRSFLIAQDVQKVLPEAISVQDDELETLGVAYTEVIPLLVASIKELKAIIDTQQEQINSLLEK